MADINPNTQASSPVTITGGNEAFQADVIEDGTEKRLLVDSKGGLPIITGISYDDMNATSGGVARGTTINTTFTRLYSYSGSGIFFGFLATLEKLDDDNPGKAYRIRLVIDGVEVFGPNGFIHTDFINPDLYGFLSDPVNPFLGISFRGNTIRAAMPNGAIIPYSSSVEVYVRKLSDFKAFRAGLIALSKD